MIAAHGIGGRQDLPIPLGTAITGAVIALIVSFAVLAATTRSDRVHRLRQRVVPFFNTHGWHLFARAIGLLFLALWAIAAVGPDSANNPIFGIVYVWWWVGLVVASLVLGPVWRAISPVRTIHDLLVKLRGGDEPLFGYSERLGYWPAAVGLLSFTWLELVYQRNDYLGPVRLWVVVYGAVMVVGGQLWGGRFFERCDPFEVYSSLVAKLSPWGRDPDVEGGQVVLRPPLSNLDTLRPLPGLVPVVSVLFGTIVYDSFRDSTPWLTFVQGHDWTSQHRYLVDNLALIAFPAAVAILFCLGTMATGVAAEGEKGVRRRELPGELAPSLVPIVIGYVVAHYLSYWWDVGRLTLAQMSDPWVRGQNWFGTAHLPMSSWLSIHTQFLADVKVLAVIVGHVLGVASAHRRAVEVLPRRHLVTGQLPLLLTMIAFTICGLYLLFAA